MDGRATRAQGDPKLSPSSGESKASQGLQAKHRKDSDKCKALRQMARGCSAAICKTLNRLSFTVAYFTNVSSTIMGDWELCN